MVGIKWGDISQKEQDKLLLKCCDIKKFSTTKGSVIIYFRNDLSILGKLIPTKEGQMLTIEDNEYFFNPTVKLIN